MKSVSSRFCFFVSVLSVSLCGWLGGGVASARVLDNFDDNTKTGWTDFTFIPGFGLPVEANGQFTFTQPPAGQAIFSASTKTTETFTIQEGRTVEFRVDLVSGNGKDSFAVLAFIPTTNSPSTLAGYGLAKSTTDILITKGINKYFYNENPTPAIKNDNVTLVLSLTGRGGNVIINAKVLDRDNNCATIFDKTFVDTPASDVLSDGTDDQPATPYFGAGYFTLYLYQDYSASSPQPSYAVTLDNAEVSIIDRAVLDNFDDNVKTGWTDFTFIPGFGLPVEANGQFTFTQPPAGQAIFSASTKTSQAFVLAEGEHLEFSVDLVDGNGQDSFAVLAYIPTTNSPSTLAGYGLAKSSTDILITKGINKYFYNENPTPAIKNNNVTLVLSLTALNGKVIINGKVLDKDNDNAVIFDKTFVDTPVADVLSDGVDDQPATPYLGPGNFTLFLYQDYSSSSPQASYQVIFDNAVVGAPPAAANAAPLITDIQPATSANFLPASTQIAFTASDDKPLLNNKISVTLNGAVHTSANGLVLSGTGNTRNVSLGGLAGDVNYVAVLQVVDSDNATNSATLYFDTFDPNDFTVEVEDYNYDSGLSLDYPILIPEGTGPDPAAFARQVGTPEVDYSDTRTDFNSVPYRPGDHIRMQHSLDIVRQKFIDFGGSALGIFDYDVGDIQSGEWMNYTRDFPPGSYLVYLREALINLGQGECALDLVTGDPTQPGQTTTPLGTFPAQRTGFEYRNIALTDGLGQNKVLRLSGAVTLRLRQITSEPADGAIFQNYLILVPTADPGLQHAAVTGVSPSSGAVVETFTPSLSVTIQNRDTLVKPETIVLKVNGATVAPNIASDANGAVVTYDLSPVPAPDSLNTAQITFTDNFNFSQTNAWSFTITYKHLDPANRSSGPGIDRGLNVRVVQAPAGTIPPDNSLQRAEDQLALLYPAFYDITVLADVINYTQKAPPDSDTPYFDGDSPIPGLYDEFGTPNGNGNDDIAMEVLTYLDLAAGIYRFGVRSDDGYKVASGRTPRDLSAPPLAFHNGGPADETFDFAVLQSGLYPFRLLWYERSGLAYVEWFSVDRTTGVKTLINDPNSPDAIKAFVTRENVFLQSAGTVRGSYADDPAAVLDAATKHITVPRNGSARFYRLRSDTPKHIANVRIVADNVVVTYE